MSHLACVPEDDLRAYALGELSGEEAATVAAHLEICPLCETVVARLDGLSDAVIRSLRQALGPADVAQTVQDAASAIIGTSSEVPPRRVAGYEILGELGRGGMSVVYKARQPGPDRLVALKMILAGAHASTSERARFLQEANAIARLQHANVVQVYEVGEHDDLPFFSLELLNGGSLADKLVGVPQPPREAAALVEVLARAVHHAHEQGVVHRDLKPANILLTEQDVPKITDFGLAKQARVEMTTTGAVLGSPPYMAPEQAMGDNRAVGPLTDVYGLGAILYECLTGRPPFRGATTADTLLQVCSQEPVPPVLLQGQTPRDLNTICLKCLSKEPQRRYRSAAELADDLRRLLDGRPIQARPAGLGERAWRWARRNPAWASALALLVLTALAAVVASVNLAEALAGSEQAHAQTREAERETLRRLYRATVNEARAMRLTGRPGQRLDSLALLAKARKLAVQLGLPEKDFHELRDEAIAALALPDLELLREWGSYPVDSNDCDFSPDMTQYARSDNKGRVTIRRVADDREIASIPGLGRGAFLRYSPDGRSLAVARVAGQEERFQLWQLGAVAPVLNLKAPPPGSHAGCRIAFRPDGRQVAYLHGDGLTLTVHDTATGREVHRNRVQAPIMHLAFHPLRPTLAVVIATRTLGLSQLGLYDLETGCLNVGVWQPAAFGWLSWDPGGKVLAASEAGKSIRLYQVSPTGQFHLVNQFLRHKALSSVAAMNANGTLLASMCRGSDARLWDAHGGQQLITPVAGVQRVSFGRDPGLLACACLPPVGKLRLYRVHLSQECRRLGTRPALQMLPGANVVFHPSGRLLLAGTLNDWGAWDAHTGQELLLAQGYRWRRPLGFDSRGALYAASRAGFERWPPRPDPQRPDVVRLGPPQVLFSPGNRRKGAVGADGRLLAILDTLNGRTQVVFSGQPGKCQWFGPQEYVHSCAISPDGRWLATGSHGACEKAALVWEIGTDKPAHAIPAMPLNCEVGFSPNGRWLVTTGGGCRLWEVGTWRPGPTYGGSAFAFSPDGKILAVQGGESIVRLVNPATSTEYARLTIAGEPQVFPACFSPDGSLLVVKGSESHALYVCDLQAIGSRLKAMGLAWELPLPRRAPASSGPVRLELVEP